MNKKQEKHDMLLTFMMHSKNVKKKKRKPALIGLLQKMVVMVLP